jgi:hypothetical protein
MQRLLIIEGNKVSRVTQYVLSLIQGIDNTLLP